MANTMDKLSKGFVSAVCLLGVGFGMVRNMICTRTYQEDPSAFANAQIGYAPMVGSTDHPNATLRYLELTWREVEPTEGQYAWDAIEQRYGLAALREQGIHLVLRFVCDVPGQKKHLDIPEWLYAQTADGSWYSTSYGKGYSPDYANDILRAAHHKVVSALAEHFDADSFVTYVELGSLGHWGEWHIKSSDGLVPMPDETIRDQYATDYLNAFSNAKLLMRRPFNIAVSNRLGLYNDMTGHEKDTNEWLNWIKNGGWYGKEANGLSAMQNFWQDAPVGGEFTSSLPMEELLDTELSRTLQLLDASHMSFLGPKAAQPAYSQGYPAVLKRLGYRLRVTTLKLMPHDGEAVVTLTVANEGAAPFYWDWAANLYLESADGTTLSTVQLPLSLPKLMPGETQTVEVVLKEVDLWALLLLHKEHLTIGIVDPMTDRDAVRFAMNAPQQNGRTVLF